MKSKFIMTTCENTAEELIYAGFKLVNKTDKSWFFINDNKLTFSKRNVSYTNKLHF